jgi:hypothetical protein
MTEWVGTVFFPSLYTFSIKIETYRAAGIGPLEADLPMRFQRPFLQ